MIFLETSAPINKGGVALCKTIKKATKTHNNTKRPIDYWKNTIILSQHTFIPSCSIYNIKEEKRPEIKINNDNDHS